MSDPRLSSPDPLTVLQEMRKQLYPQETLKIAALETAIACVTLVPELREMVERWRAAARIAERQAANADARGDQAGNAHACLKERRIWNTCADQLAALCPPPKEPRS